MWWGKRLFKRKKFIKIGGLKALKPTPFVALFSNDVGRCSFFEHHDEYQRHKKYFKKLSTQKSRGPLWQYTATLLLS
jgi:hypothetical protein